MLIDTDARWGFSHTKGLIFVYKLHLISLQLREKQGFCDDIYTAKNTSTTISTNTRDRELLLSS